MPLNPILHNSKSGVLEVLGSKLSITVNVQTASQIATGNLQELKQHVSFVVGVPVKPMLAKPTVGVSEVLDKFQDIEFTCEYKYDGERAQVHISEGGKVSIYR